ncbi:efflux RND transporter permease subunit [Motiliproteus sp. MSK22-1]|uniref:efflux RND transporter permease subunit n=1 Tax=Motiliproteus sp. MSK22-1 TaxID=1897630 RepID=UPI000977D367|nr:efflux RND transporter permease subunit [Motiliproteus sp. MSK22-1]OMH25848.1 acriflavine resistance protein B [Motiliproteus sp. MSK22-1]
MITWFARNPVAANLLMILILLLGANALNGKIPLEVFPSRQLDQIVVRIMYPGSTPRESEEGITIRVEEEIQDLEGIEEIKSGSGEGASVVSVEVADGYNTRDLMDDIKSRVDGISTFPEEAERPIISISARRHEVISTVIYGDRSEMQLRRIAEEVRDEISNLSGITQVSLDSSRDYELAIEVSEATLREYGLTLSQVAEAVNRGSIDLSAGNIRTLGADILVRTKGQAYNANDFRRIPIVTQSDGSRIELGDIATIRDGFEDNPVNMRFDGQQAVAVDIYRVGNQSSIEVADQVKRYIERKQSLLPEGVKLDYWRDRSNIVKARLQTLTNSAIQGGILVLLLLTLFLRPTVAFWVCAGIPVCFMGGFMLMPVLGVSLNIASLFAFILVLGIVVDDAIVTGENIYTHFNRGSDGLTAAIQGTREVAIPVTFGILTTVAAFVPLAMVEGRRAVLFEQIPYVVIPVLLFSLVESKLILPAHLRHLKPPSDDNWLSRLQQTIARGLERGIHRFYSPFLDKVLEFRYLTLALIVGFSLIVFAMVFSGWTKFLFFPRVQSELARATLVMPAGTPFAVTDKHIERITLAAQTLQDKYLDQATGKSIITHVLSTSGSGGSSASGHLGRVIFEIVPPEYRTLDITSSQLVREWRKLIGTIPGAESINYRAEIGRYSDPIDIRLMGDDLDQLKRLAGELKARLATYSQVFDIADSLSNGKQELQIKLKPEGELLGVNLVNIARQVRQAFFGFEIQRIQRGKDDVKVLVRYSAEERNSLETLDSMMIRTDQGVEVPFREVAELSSDRSPSSITRINRRRTVNVSADINKDSADLPAIMRDLNGFLEQRLVDYPSVSTSLEGEAKEQRDSFSGLFWGLLFVLFITYGLLAIPFRSYIQPFIVMSVIPFGVVGAIVGHWLMGMSLTIMSLMGMLALAGVVVNDSLVLVDYINRHRQMGESLHRTIRMAGVARFRPVLLTSLTTFAGLMPLIFEKSTQAQFLIPMAVSLGFGILFATLITLLVVPVNYLVLEDLIRLFGRQDEVATKRARQGTPSS